MSKKIDIKILNCPRCKSTNLEKKDDLLTCLSCTEKYSLKSDKIIFTKLEQGDVCDNLDKLKFIIKKYSFLYDLLIKIISPVYHDGLVKRFVKENINSDRLVAINFGSGNSNLSDYISNVDIFEYDNVNMTCDITNIPIQDNQVDCIINIAVLEHVPNPEKVVSEFYRILKPDGKIICFIPFIQGFHASPYDFSRRTYEGMKVLFKNYNIDQIVVSGGPTSGMLWILQDWLAILFSCGSKKLYSLLYMFFMLVTFPIKFLDVILRHHPYAKNIASGFIVIATKKEV